MAYLLLFIAIIVALWAMIVYLDRVKYAADIRALQGSTEGYDRQYFSEESLPGFPDPVHRYLSRVIPEGYPLINLAHLTHTGRFRTSPEKDWVDIKGEAYYSTRVPGFIWRGKTRSFTADDRYFANRGSLKVKLFSIFPVVSATGKHIDVSELQRWIGEHFWFPTNLLNQNLFQWEAIDDQSSLLTLRYHDLEIPVIFHFDEEGLIEKISCQRYNQKGDLAEWSGQAMDYDWINGLYVPTRVKARWHSHDDIFTYADFELTSLDFIPESHLQNQSQEAWLMAHSGSP